MTGASTAARSHSSAVATVRAGVEQLVTRMKQAIAAAGEKWELFTSVLTGQFTHREAAAKWQVDRTTVTTICRTAKEEALAALSAKPGRPGKSPEQVELEDARAELEQQRATITAQAVELSPVPGKIALGLPTLTKASTRTGTGPAVRDFAPPR